MLAHRRNFAFLGLVLLCQTPGCTMYLARAEVKEQQTIDLSGVKHFCVDTRNGAIDIQCDPTRKDADIRAVKYACGLSESEALPYAEAIEIDAARDPKQADTVRVVASWPKDHPNRSRGVRFNIALPPNATLDLNTSNGSVNIARAAAGANIETSNGHITVLDTRGNVSAHTNNGRVTLTGVDGDVDAHTSNGQIQLDRVGTASVKAVTSNGGIYAANVKGNVAVKTSNGSIDLRIVAMQAKPEISAVSSNGRVLVEAPAGVNAKLHMRTSNGRVHANLNDVGTMRDFDSGRQHLSATLNQGEGLIEIQSSNGGVTFQTVGKTSAAPVALAR